MPKDPQQGLTANNATVAVQEKPVPEKKFSTAARVARGLGLKKADKSSTDLQKIPNGDQHQQQKPAQPNSPLAAGQVPAPAPPLSPVGTQPPILVTNKITKPPAQTQTLAGQQQMVLGGVNPPQASVAQLSVNPNSGVMYRLDRVPEDEWTIMEVRSHLRSFYDKK